MQLFVEDSLSQYLSQRTAKLKQEIYSENKAQLLNVNEASYIEYLVEKYKVDCIDVYWEDAYASDFEKMIPSSSFPSEFYVLPGKSYPKQVIRFHIPFSGDKNLLRYQASTFFMISYEAQVDGDEICFDFVNWRDDPDQIRREFDSVSGTVKQQVSFTQRDVNQYNNALVSVVTQSVQDRKGLYLKQSNLMASLGVPVKKSPQVPGTFAVPAIKKQPIIKPVSPSTAFVAEPTLDDSTYRDIVMLPICQTTHAACCCCC